MPRGRGPRRGAIRVGQPGEPLVSQAWAVGDDVLVRRYGDLRGLCAWCGRPSTQSQWMKLSSAHGLLRAFFAIAPLPNLPYDWLLQKSAGLELGVCDRHVRRRRRVRWFVWSSIVIGALAMAFAFVPDEDSTAVPALFGGGLLLVMLALLVFWIASRGPHAIHGGTQGVVVSGIHRDVVARLPRAG